LVAAGWDLPPVERRRTGGMTDDALPVGPERAHHLVRATGDPLAFGHARPLVRLIGGCADGVEVEIPVPRPGGDRQKRRGGAELVAVPGDERLAVPTGEPERGLHHRAPNDARVGLASDSRAIP